MKPESDPSTSPDDSAPDTDRAWLSALADGDAAAADRACGSWRAGAASREAWRTYHLIGDVMRSEELARPAAGDVDFLARFSARLAEEPVVLAPVSAPVRRRQPWLLPAAAAASFVVVAGVLVLTRGGLPVPGADMSAVASADSVRPAASAVQRLDPALRDPWLDEYMRAHRQVVGGVAAAAPGGMMRRVDMSVNAAPER